MNTRGFLLIEVLIASLIISSGVAATFLLFRQGFENIDRVRKINYISSNLPYIVNYLKSEKSLKQDYQINGITVKVSTKLLRRNRPARTFGEDVFVSGFEFELYKVDITLDYEGIKRDYSFSMLKYNKVSNEEEF